MNNRVSNEERNLPVTSETNDRETFESYVNDIRSFLRYNVLHTYTVLAQ